MSIKKISYLIAGLLLLTLLVSCARLIPSSVSDSQPVPESPEEMEVSELLENLQEIESLTADLNVDNNLEELANISFE
ncbi:MAG TPA: hypothetical protein VJH68_04655 [Candidatus Nanoarchaeia archaeon]|nr:hypothetical protein [Candidatus Nanoarchaeia archaeon]